MTQMQKIIKYCALALAVLLILGIISTIFSIATYFLSDQGIKETTDVVDIEGEFDSLKVELGATSLTVQVGETFRAETNNTRLKFQNTDGTLSITEKNEFPYWGNRREAVLILTLPADLVMHSFTLEAGAGKVEIETLSADRIDFDLGAGEVTVNALYANESADIAGGAGRIEISSGSMTELDLDMGVGELILRSALCGNSEIDCGVGSTEITLLGSDSDYSLDISKGIGEVTVNGKSVDNDEKVGNGMNKLSVSGGIGSIRISYEAQ